MSRSDGAPSFTGPRIIVALLVVSLILVGVLTWQAQDMARSHRMMAERVLRDFAALAAAEFIRRATNELAYYGYQPLMNAIREAHRSRAGAFPDQDDLAARESTARAVELVRRVFHYDRRADEVVERGDRLPEPVRARLHATLRSAEATDAQGFKAAIHRVGNRTHIFIYGAADDHTLLGFEVDMKVVPQWLDVAAKREPLLPPSLADGDVRADWVFLAVEDGEGRRLFSTRPEADPALTSALGTTRRFGTEGNGILAGFNVRTAIDVAAAPQLVIGGLPRSRLPALATLLVVTAGLMLMAMLLLRRERAVVRLRSDFVSRVSHELRTPLTQIRLFAETLLLGRTRSAEEHHRALQAIDRESRRLTGLVDNVLQFSRGERDQIQVTRRTQAVAPLVEAVLDESAQLSSSRVGKVDRHLRSGALADIDEDAFRQVLLNLLDNAVKYGPSGQTLRVGVDDDGTDVTVWVEDEGPGVPAVERDRIWRPYYRLARDRESERSGAGIGLAVAKELIERHDGRIWVEAPVTGGARFVLALPSASTATPTDTIDGDRLDPREMSP